MDEKALTRMLEKRPVFFTIIKGVFSLAMNKSTVFENLEYGISFTILDLTDGKYWIPAVVPDQALNEALKAHGEDFKSMMETLQGTNIILTEVMVGVYRRGEWLAPHLIVHKCEITNMAAPKLPRLPQDICFLPSVTKWLTELQKEIPKDSNEWYTALFPKSKKTPGHLKDGIIEIYQVVEHVLVNQYDELPPLDEIEPPLPRKTFKRRSTETQDANDRPQKQIKQETEEQPKPDQPKNLTQSMIVDMWQDMTMVALIDCIISKGQQALLDAQYGRDETPTIDASSPSSPKVLEIAIDMEERTNITTVQGDTAQSLPVISGDDEELENSEPTDPFLYWEKKHASYVDMVDGFDSKLCLLL
ncbi:hypothetical protein BJV82DRAFT_668000 [Fennellomyces sp. T-0311]|nr:hypothetical protein BJV82DRAFT_668000 [Fennellomyces sp. T-0311]